MAARKFSGVVCNTLKSNRAVGDFNNFEVADCLAFFQIILTSVFKNRRAND
jgi:hypothetical protein